MTLTLRLFLALATLLSLGAAHGYAQPTTEAAEYQAFRADMTALAAHSSNAIVVEEGFTCPIKRAVPNASGADNSLLPLEQMEQTVALKWGYRVRKVRGVTVFQKRYDTDSDPPYITRGEWERFNRHMTRVSSSFPSSGSPLRLLENFEASLTDQQLEPLAAGIPIRNLSSEQQAMLHSYSLSCYVAPLREEVQPEQELLQATLTRDLEVHPMEPTAVLQITFDKGRESRYPNRLSAAEHLKPETVVLLSPFAATEAAVGERIEVGSALISRESNKVLWEGDAGQHLVSVFNRDKLTATSLANAAATLFDLSTTSKGGVTTVRAKSWQVLPDVKDLRQSLANGVPARLRRYLQVEPLPDEPPTLSAKRADVFKRRLARMQALACFTYLSLPAKGDQSATHPHRQVLATVVGTDIIAALEGILCRRFPGYLVDIAEATIKAKRTQDGDSKNFSIQMRYPFEYPELGVGGEDFLMESMRLRP